MVCAVQSIRPDLYRLMWLFRTESNLLFLELPVLSCVFWPRCSNRAPFPFSFPSSEQRQSPLLSAGGVFAGHVLGKQTECPVADGGSPRALGVDSTEALDASWAEWTGPRAAGLCVYLPEHLAASSSALLGAGRWGEEGLRGMALYVFGTVGRVGNRGWRWGTDATKIRAPGKIRV